MYQEIEDSAVVLWDRYRRFPEAHHLHDLTTPGPRPRLRSIGEQSFRQDWRSVARKRLDQIPEGGNVIEHLVAQREDRQLQHYNENAPESSAHRRASGGKPLERSVSRSRQEEVILFKLRANRATFLRQTQNRFGYTDDPLCESCGEEEESSELFLIRCKAWSEERKETIGENDDITCLQTNPERVYRFVQLTGRLAASPDQ